MTVAAVLDLGERLRRERARRFVGRGAELELLAARLEAAAAAEAAFEHPDADIPAGFSDQSDLFNVLWVHGPGGIGKSTLLAAYAETAHNDGFTVAQVDGGRIRPTAAASGPPSETR